MQVEYRCLFATRQSAECDGCMQGNCSGAPPDLSGPALATLRPNQCVLQTAGTLFAWNDRDAANDVWIDNLYIRAPVGQGAGAAKSSIAWYPNSDSRLWLTNMTIQGGMVAVAASKSMLCAGVLCSNNVSLHHA
jgi:hypothetical protein